MPQPLGRLVLVLHGHLPYVLHHGNWPHGEAWLYEAAAETYLPLLDLLDTFADQPVSITFTLGLTPVLLEQLADDYFKTGFVAYLIERMNRAKQDARQFRGQSNDSLSGLAGDWESWYQRQLTHFEKLNRNLPGAFAAHGRAGRIEILSSAATHAYLPLLLSDNSINAQIRAGLATSKKHLGIQPSGFWLPECAYRPAVEHWKPPVLHEQPRPRIGLEIPLAAVGVSHFFVDAPLIAHAQPMAIIKPDGIHTTADALVHWDTQRGWGSPLDPVGVVSEPRSPDVFAFARHPKVSEQVWSGIIGYPGAGEYLEFHRKHGSHGLRYHRVTNQHTPLHEKSVYDPALVPGKIYEHAHHFCSVIRTLLSEYTAQTGRVGTIVAPFDAELFGHWWFEGPRFLHDVLLTLAHEGSVQLTSAAQALEQSPADKVVRLPEGSWGAGGQHQVWLNDQTRWLWETQYRAEERFLHLLASLPWQTNLKVREVLQDAGRELLLLQASDWPFVIHSGGATDYGITRFSLHANRFDRLATIAQHLTAGETLTPLQQIQITEARAHDRVFADIDLNWWS